MQFETSDTAKELFRQHLLSISQSARVLVPLLKDITVSEISGVPTTLEDVIILVNPKDGEIGFWNINTLFEKTLDNFRTIEMAANERRRELMELDEEIAKRRQSLAASELRMPSRKFDVN